VNTFCGKKFLQTFLIALALVFCTVPMQAQAEEDSVPLAGPKKKNSIGEDYTFVYQFNKRPQLGVVILKIELFDKEGKQDSSLNITGDSGMPSMRGSHDTGEVEFKLNQKGDYLLPVDVMMPGDWDVRLIFRKDGEIIHRASITFDV
jgi:hypothetical protein